MAGVETAGATVSGPFMHEDGTAIFYPVRSKIIVMMLASAAMAGLCFAMAADVIPVRASLVSRAVLSAGGVFFAAVAVFWAQQLSIRGGAIEVSRTGFRDARLSADLVPWAAIESVGTYSHYRQRQIILHLKQGLLGKIRRSPLRRLLDTCNAPFYGAAGVQINPRALSGSIDDILAAIDRLAPPSVGRGW